MRGLNWQTISIPLGYGLNQKADPRALQPPELSRLVDGQIDELGGLQTRYPFALQSGPLDIFGGGSITGSDVRRVVENGDELLLFTKDELYSRLSGQSKWSLRGTHLAVKVEEAPRFIAPGDQVEGDRAELSGTIVFAWRDGTSVYVAATDKSTGSVLMSPTAIATSQRPRLVALSTKILLFTVNSAGTELAARALDPAAPATAVAGAATTVFGTDGTFTFDDYYDVTRVIGADQAVFACRLTASTSYRVGTLTAGLTLAGANVARVCDGPIAVSCTPDGVSVQVVRSDGTDIEGDLITISSLADTAHVNTAIGTVVTDATQIAAAHQTVLSSGEYRCQVFWGDVSLTRTKTNWVDTGGNLGSESVLVYLTHPASRAFDHDGSVYVNVAFAGESSTVGGMNVFGQRAQLQNSYFLYRDDGFLVAKQTMFRAGGYPTTAHLPGVALTSGTTVYSWCGTERRIIPLGGDHTGYADRGPRDITLTFDSNDARRCVRMGGTMYIAAGEVLQYDGVRLAEVGFHYFPYYIDLNEDLVNGTMDEGTYYYKGAYRWDNGVGDTERSTTATVAGLDIGASPGSVDLTSGTMLYITHKEKVAVEWWRTLKDPTDDASFYLITSKDPTVTTGANCYIENDTTTGTMAAFDDELVDDDARRNETHPENGSVLESIAPPAASIIAASERRLFLAGIAGEPHRVWYSKLRNEGDVAAFNDALAVDIPPEGGLITALAMHNETLVVFREHATYVLLNDGFDNVGGGQNYVARRVPGDVGAVNHESVAATHRGLIFKSSKGWYLLNNGIQLEYIGGPVCDYDSQTPLAVQVTQSQHQVRILTASRMLVLDTVASDALGRPIWFEWSIADGAHACMWNGAHVYLTTSGVKAQQTSYTSLTYGMDVEWAWIKFADMQGFAKVNQIQILGEYRSAHRVRVRLARDYWKDGDGTYFQDKTWTVSPTTVGAREKLKHGPSVRSVEALKIRLTILGPGSDSTPSGEALRLSGLSLEVGFYPGLNRMLPSAQRQ